MADSIIFEVNGIPMGYVRTTQAGCKFDDNYRKYQTYKDKIVKSFIKNVEGSWGVKKPLTTLKTSKTHMSVKMYFANGRHPDPDNVFKAVADSLFQCDKYLTGEFDYDYDKENPRLVIKIS